MLVGRRGIPLVALLPHPRGLTSDRVTAEREQIMVEAHVAGSGARCPHCSAHARRVHRRYRRTIADLPLAERRTTCPCGCAASVAHNRAAHGCPSSRRWPTWPPVNVLPGCVAGDFATRLATHPGTEIICRDRGGYAEGARRGAPAAAQVADRFHLLQNLGAALERLVARLRAGLRTRPSARCPPPTRRCAAGRARRTGVRATRPFRSTWHAG